VELAARALEYSSLWRPVKSMILSAVLAGGRGPVALAGHRLDRLGAAEGLPGLSEHQGGGVQGTALAGALRSWPSAVARGLGGGAAPYRKKCET